MAGWNLALQIGASIGSLGAVTGFIAAGTELAKGYELYWKLGAGLIGVISAVCAALPPLVGHADRINRFERLHFAYCELFHLAKLVTMDVRREGIITAKQRGAAKLLEDLYSRLGQQDDPDHKDKLRDRYEKVVREKYPENSLWYANEDGNQATPAATLQA